MERFSRTLVHAIGLSQRHADWRKPRRFARSVLLAAASLPIYLAAFPTGVAADLIGTVLQQGKPVPNAVVELAPRAKGAQPPTKTSTTDASGRYTMTGIVPGPYQLKCKLANANKERIVPVDVGYAINRLDCSL